jgi:hypothetical protein
MEHPDMNALLEKALAEVARLPEEEQEIIATLILDEALRQDPRPIGRARAIGSR